MPQVDFGKITLLTGANSTGKSSLMYGVLGVLQGNSYPYTFSVNGRYVNMGNFLEMVSNHDENKVMAISHTFVDSKSNISYSIKTEWEKDNVGNPRFLSCECRCEYFYYLLKKGIDENLYLSIDYEPAKNPNSRKMQELLSSISEEDAELKNIVEFLKYSSEEVHIKEALFPVADGNWDEIDNKTKNSHLLLYREILSVLATYNKSINYISSYRQPAQRFYTEKKASQEKIEPSGEGFINELLTWRDSDKDKFDTFVQSMRSIGILADVVPARTGEGQFKVNIRAHENDKEVNLSDAGFGISQFVPVVIGDVELGKDSTLYVSQPEVHLHPKAQANFGDYLVRQTKQDKRYVIETHSEYLLNRLRLAIVKGELLEDDVKTYYISQENGKTKLSAISFNKRGQITGAPQDFFDTYMIDVMDIAMNAE